MRSITCWPYTSPNGEAGGFRVTLHHGQVRPKTDPGLRDSWSGILADGTHLVCRNGPGRRQLEVPGCIRADVDLSGRVARIVVKRGGERGLLEACVLPMLCDCFGQAGHHVIHAASLFVSTGGRRRALIVSGASGAGKTTLALALAGAGLGMLADDMTFYHAATGGRPGQIWGIRTRCKVLPQTFNLLPWLRDLPAQGAGSNGGQLLDSRPLKPLTTGLTASPGLILFLNPRNSKAHRIEPMDKVAALTRLTRENVRAVERRREAVAGRAFAALAELVRSSRTFEASLCPRLDELPDRLATLWF